MKHTLIHPKFNIKQLKHHLKAKAVLSAGLTITFINEIDGDKDVWQFTDGLSQY
jgi:topoisomerase-4 subunit B